MRMCVLDCWTVVLHFISLLLPSGWRHQWRQRPHPQSSSPPYSHPLPSSSLVVDSQFFFFFFFSWRFLPLRTPNVYFYKRHALLPLLVLLQFANNVVSIIIIRVCIVIYNSNCRYQRHKIWRTWVPFWASIQVLAMSCFCEEIWEPERRVCREALSKPELEQLSRESHLSHLSIVQYLPTDDDILQVHYYIYIYIYMCIIYCISHSFILIVIHSLLQNTSHGSLSTIGKWWPRLGTTRFGKCLYQLCVLV